MYTVIEAFPDALDKCYNYKVGDTYPREGVEPTEERIAELLGDANARKRPLIAEVKEEKPTAKKKG